MKVLHVLASRSTKWGGPPRTIANLLRNLGHFGVETTVVTLDEKGAAEVDFGKGVRVIGCGVAVVSKLGLPSSVRVIRVLLEEIAVADVVHLHELWHLPQLLAAIACRVIGRRYLVSLHGELEAHSLGQHKLLKRALWLALQRAVIENAAVVHALTPHEARSARAAGVTSPIQIVPSGIDLEVVDTYLRNGLEPEAGSARGASPYVLYLGRLDPKKGVEVLLEAFSILSKNDHGIHLTLVGPDPFDMWPRLYTRAAQLEVQDRIEYLGFVDGMAKFRLMAEAKLFVSPSMTEGLSIAALEALACGTPVITSPASNLPEIELSKSGRIVEPTPLTLSNALDEILADDKLREAMRSNARKLIEERFSSDRAAARMAELYRQILIHPSSPTH